MSYTDSAYLWDTRLEHAIAFAAKLTVHNLDAVLDGGLDELTAALADDEKGRRLEAQAAGVEGTSG